MKRLFSVLFSMKGLVGAALGFITLLAPTLALADELNSGDTAWMITATVLVLMMTIPGLSLFYAGMVRSKNVLSVMMQCFAITCLVTVIWVVYGYSMAFDTTGMEAGVVNLNSIIGGFGNTFLQGISVDSGSNLSLIHISEPTRPY